MAHIAVTVDKRGQLVGNNRRQRRDLSTKLVDENKEKLTDSKKTSQKSFFLDCHEPKTQSGLFQGYGGVEMGEPKERVQLAKILSNSCLRLLLQLFGRVHRLQVRVKCG